MTTSELFQQWQQQAETELHTLTLRAEGLAGENKQLRSEITHLKGTLEQMSRASQQFVAEYRERAHAATSSEIALRAQLVCAHDHLLCTAQDLQGYAEGLIVPERVLSEYGYEVNGVNPLHKVREIRKQMAAKVKALRKFAVAP